MSKTKTCSGKHTFERMNYLFQVSNIALAKANDNAASALYSNLLISISKKSVQRMEPEIKRMLCKRCRSVIVADVSGKVRIRNKRVRWTCSKCHSVKVFKAVPKYLPWVQNPEAVVEILKY